MKPLELLRNTLPQTGHVSWLGLRPEKRAAIIVVDKVEVNLKSGLIGDRYAGRSGKRQITLMQAEHLPVIASLLNLDSIDPATLRRNICITGLNLLALKEKHFQIGEAVLEYTGLCHPCSFMEKTFGQGGYNAIRGHGGITARVLKAGVIKLNDCVFTLK